VAPGDTALVYDGDRVTYGLLAERVDRLASSLRERGVGPGDRVAYLGPNHPAFVEVMFAACAIGGVFVPLNTRLAAAELAAIVRDAEVTTLVFAPELEDVATAVLQLAPTALAGVGGCESRAGPPPHGSLVGTG
jgi:fatty-acyl-CoA synthase